MGRPVSSYRLNIKDKNVSDPGPVVCIPEIKRILGRDRKYIADAELKSRSLVLCLNGRGLSEKIAEIKKRLEEGLGTEVNYAQKHW